MTANGIAVLNFGHSNAVISELRNIQNQYR
jgi:hypothetical protein